VTRALRASRATPVHKGRRAIRVCRDYREILARRATLVLRALSS
jgi:hypothetical protein